MSNRDDDTLDELIESEIVTVNEEGLTVRTEEYSKVVLLSIKKSQKRERFLLTY